MKSYFFYYFEKDDGPVPFFEVVNCDDDGHAAERCGRLLALRGSARAEVWFGEQFICRLDGPGVTRPAKAHAA
jgi:hypothetical protein